MKRELGFDGALTLCLIRAHLILLIRHRRRSPSLHRSTHHLFRRTLCPFPILETISKHEAAAHFPERYHLSERFNECSVPRRLTFNLS